MRPLAINTVFLVLTSGCSGVEGTSPERPLRAATVEVPPQTRTEFVLPAGVGYEFRVGSTVIRVDPQTGRGSVFSPAGGTATVRPLRGANAAQLSFAETEARTPSAGGTRSEAAALDPGSVFNIQLHDQLTIPSVGVANYSVSGGAIRVTVDPTSADFVITGEQVGTATVLLLYADGRRSLLRVDVIDP